MTLAAGTKLGAYEIVAPLGAGGMGEVYRARDTKLKREVAVKVLPQSLAADPDALARFEREALAVAALSHPNILAIFDFGTQDGTAFAVTELLEGETLRGKIDGAAVSQKQAIDWCLQIVKGLSAAHGKGVIHRDLKPDNVFVTRDGHVKILDFGLAKREEVTPEEQTSAPTGSGHTAPGTVMGTMGYMSPEQLRGLPVDQRSDIFSFGAILYELLSGRKAFKRDTATDTIVAVLKEEPPDLTQTGRNISPALDHIVSHCLEKDRDNRFQTAKDVTFALSEASSPTTAVTSGVQAVVVPERTSRRNALIAGAIVAALAVAGLLIWKWPKSGTPAAGGPKRIAVLPFENLGASEDDYFADGITDEIRAKLTKVPGIEVLARGSSTPYKKTTKTPQEIAEELSASYLLTATVRWQKGSAGSRVQVIPELVEVHGDAPPASKWQQPFDAALTDVFQVQSDIATRVAQALGVALAAKEEKSLAERPTENLAAYDAFLKGEEASSSLSRTDPPTLRRALTFYEQAVALDPGFVLAWARLGYGNALLYANGVPSPSVEARSREAAEKATALAPRRADGHKVLGDYQRLVKKDFARALQHYDEAVQLAPADAEVLGARGRAEITMGRWDAGLQDFQEAARLDPRSTGILRSYSDALLRVGRRDEARQMLRRFAELDPNSLPQLWYTVVSYLGGGDLSGARRTVADARPRLSQPELVAHIAAFYDLVWVLDAEQLELLRRLSPAAFDDDAAGWAMCQAEAAWLGGDVAGAREYAGKSVVGFGEQLAAAPGDAQLHAARGVALAMAGRGAEAVQDGERALDLGGPDKDLNAGPFILYSLARIHVLNGEMEKAIDALERLVKVPNLVTRGWLRIDPYVAPLRSNPRFQKLVAASK